MSTALNTTQLLQDYQASKFESDSRSWHHHRTVDRIWPSALEVRVAQWSMEDIHHNEHERSHQHVGRAWSSSHITPAPPSSSHKNSDQGDDRGYDTDNGFEFDHDDDDRTERHREGPHRWHRRSASYIIPLTLATEAIHSKSATAVESKRSNKHPNGYSGDSAPPTPFFLASTMIESKSSISDLSPADAETDPITEDSLAEETLMIYTPQAVRTSQSSTPWFTHFSSTASSPTLSRRPSLTRATSPQTFMLQGFLARHSNGHIMYRRPINCSAECSDGCSSSGSEEEDGSATQSFGTDEEEELDDRFILLAQSPNPNEFEYSEFFNTEAEKKTRLHQADSPVFFNGFPLLQMTAMDRG